VQFEQNRRYQKNNKIIPLRLELFSFPTNPVSVRNKTPVHLYKSSWKAYLQVGSLLFHNTGYLRLQCGRGLNTQINLSTLFHTKPTSTNIRIHSHAEAQAHALLMMVKMADLELSWIRGPWRPSLNNCEHSSRWVWPFRWMKRCTALTIAWP